MKKKLITFTLPVILSIILCFSSCSKRFEANFSDQYTFEYINNNYILASDNLEALYISDNSIRTREPGDSVYSYKIHQIKDVPLEDYICYAKSTFGCYDRFILQNKELAEDTFLSLDIEKIELYWRKAFLPEITPEVRYDYGQNRFYKRIATVEDPQDLKNYISDYLGNSENLVTFDDDDLNESEKYALIERKVDGTAVVLNIKVSFKNYPYLVWHSDIFNRDGSYYINYSLREYEKLAPNPALHNYYFQNVFIPLGDDIVSLIPQNVKA